MNLIIGGDGFIGSALRKRIRGHSNQVGGLVSTSRRYKDHLGGILFDLRAPIQMLPDASIVYLVAGIAGFRGCEQPGAYEVNVDGNLRVAHRFKDAFVVFLSSEAVMSCPNTALGRMKSLTEIGLLSIMGYENLAVVRPPKVTSENVNELCAFLERVGNEKLYGVHAWPNS